MQRTMHSDDTQFPNHQSHNHPVTLSFIQTIDNLTQMAIENTGQLLGRGIELFSDFPYKFPADLIRQLRIADRLISLLQKFLNSRQHKSIGEYHNRIFIIGVPIRNT